MLQSLYVQKILIVQDNVPVHVYTLHNSLCSTDAVWLKDEFQKLPQGAELVLDLSQVQKLDLTAINTLAQAHKWHALSVVMPVCPKAAELLHLTKFTDILRTLPTVPVYHQSAVFA